MPKCVVVLLMMCVVSAGAIAQAGDAKVQQPTPTQSTQPEAAVRPNPAQQMQLDLNQMESLLSNMSAQVNFVRDTNMSILLNTNVRLWSVLLRDLRLQLEEQQRERSAAPDKTNPQLRYGDAEKH